MAVALSDKYLLVAEANRRAYDEGYARTYVERVLNTPRDQALLDREIARAVADVGDLGRPVRALDCCGGAGNATRRLMGLGCRVTLVDISGPMIREFVERCRRDGVDPPATHVSEIASYLDQTEERFDLVVFSSALHHLEDPVLVLTLARRVLEPGGVVVTLFDPVRLARWRRLLAEPARLADAALASPGRLWSGGRRVLRRLLRGGSGHKQRAAHLDLTPETVGHIAEYHGGTGIDDVALAHRLEGAGYRVLRHDRYLQSGGPLRTLVLRALRSPSSFEMFLRKA